MEEATAAEAACLPEELVVEILARLPAELLGRFKCVSRSWRALICDPALRARLAQPLSGFFHLTYGCPPWRFAGLPAFPGPTGGNGGPPLIDTTLSFVPRTCGQMELLDSCIAPCSSYVVCNPATREWVALPQPRQRGTWEEEKEKTQHVALGFDPAISSQFHVFQLVVVYQQVQAAEIYSSETGRWVRSESGLRSNRVLFFITTGLMTYFNGFLYFTLLLGAFGSVDTKGQSWRLIPLLPRRDGHICSYIGHCDGRLIYVDDDREDNVLSVYVLEDQERNEWTFKHSVRKLDLFELGKSQWWPKIAAFHPNGNLIFFHDGERLISYNMNHGDWNVICDLQYVACGHCRRHFCHTFRFI